MFERLYDTFASFSFTLGRLDLYFCNYNFFLYKLKFHFFPFLPDEVPFYAASDERIVELQGEALKVLKALEAVIGHLRKFLVDHSVLPLFEKNVSLLLSDA